MRTLQWIQIAAMASSFGLVGNAIAADAGDVTRQMQDNGARHMQDNDTHNGRMDSVGGSERLDNNTNRADFDVWMHDYSGKHNGRITRQEYLDHMGERWDRLDTEHRGYLTPEQARGIYYGRDMKAQ